MDYGIFNVRPAVNACDCTWGCTDTVRESALKFDSGRKIPCCTGESNLRRRRAGPVLYQLRYIPIPGLIEGTFDSFASQRGGGGGEGKGARGEGHEFLRPRFPRAYLI